MIPRIGRYELLDKLGEGGMGQVFLAEDRKLDRRVAIKTIHADIADQTARQRMWREARTAASLNHPNICQVFEVGDEDGTLFIAMELLEGESLAARLTSGPLPLAEALDMGLDILAALDAMHRAGVVHRDLKPSNVFLTPHGVKLLDFGLVLPFDGGEGERLTRTGIFIGTPGYMAPEQWLGEEIGPAVDLFALGAILLEAISGAPAFKGNAPAEYLHRVLNAQAPTLTGGAAVEAADRVIQRAVAKRAAERPPSARAMAEELRAVRQLVDGTETPGAITLHRMLVVPFRWLKPDAETDFLSFGLADALVTSLNGIDGLVVKSSHVGQKYAGAELDLQRIADETGVELVLVGTLLRAGDRLRVHAQLLEPGGACVWSESSEASLGDLFALQDDLARRIVKSLALKLAPSRGGALQQDIPKSPKAYQYFLRANQLSYNFHMLGSARDLYRACVEEDPEYAPAWARLGRVLRVRGKYGHGDPEADLKEAEGAFRKALALSPDLPIAHNLFAYYEIEELGCPDDAMRRLLEQVRRSPTDADLWAGLVVACRFCGLLDASLEADRRARRLDPGIRTSVAYTFLLRGEYEEAIAHDDEDMGWVRYYALPMLGRREEAVRLCRAREAASTSDVERNFLATDRAALEGNREECREASLAVFGSCFHDPEGLYFVVRNLISVGAVEEGLARLPGIVERGFWCDHVLQTDPWLDGVKESAEYRTALESARAGRRMATKVYVEAGGPGLLGEP